MTTLVNRGEADGISECPQVSRVYPVEPALKRVAGRQLHWQSEEPTGLGWLCMKTCCPELVRRRGLEPLCLAALAPQASASANFATSAWGLRALQPWQERRQLQASV